MLLGIREEVGALYKRAPEGLSAPTRHTNAAESAGANGSGGRVRKVGAAKRGPSDRVRRPLVKKDRE